MHIQYDTPPEIVAQNLLIPAEENLQLTHPTTLSNFKTHFVVF